MDKPFADPHALVNTFGFAALTAGFSGVFIPVSTSVVLAQAFPGTLGQLWFVSLMLCGLIALLGDNLQRYEGPPLVVFGLGVGGCLLLSYGVLLLVVAGWPSVTAASFILALAIACLFRANRVRIRNRNLTAALLSKRG